MNLHVMRGDKTLLTKNSNHKDFQELWVSANIRGIYKQLRTKKTIQSITCVTKTKDYISLN